MPKASVLLFLSSVADEALEVKRDVSVAMTHLELNYYEWMTEIRII